MLHILDSNMRDSFKLSLETTYRLCEIIDTPRSLAVALMLQHGEWEEYLDLSIDPEHYEDPRNFALDYLVSEIMRKNPDFPLDHDLVLNAQESFIDSEASCKQTNKRLEGDKPAWFSTLEYHISSMLGPLTDRDLAFVQDSFRFGPGASTGIRGIGSSMSDKYDKPLHMTKELIFFFRSILGESWWEHHRDSKHTIVEGNKFTTVPKSAKTNRGICVEPDLNMYVQLGIGALLRKRLKRFGVDLNSQGRNQHLAQIAYSKELCTIDLSAASDSVSTGLVQRLLPEPWLELLDLVRSPKCFINGEWIELEKWSSMGNGYTFELESLLFFSVVKTFVPRKDLDKVAVYGDDLIFPRKYAPAVIDALEFLGFGVNRSKSFLAGSFFESCGSDYWKGFNVRPFYLKGGSSSVDYRLQIANKLRVYARRLNCEQSCDITFKPVWDWLSEGLPSRIRSCTVPLEFGDIGLITSMDEAVTSKPKGGIEGVLVRTLTVRPRFRRKNSLGVLLAALSTLERKPFRFRESFKSIDDAPLTTIFSYGRETRRGLYGKTVTRVTVVQRWSLGLSWNSPLL